jgi:hypothetical protein
MSKLTNKRRHKRNTKKCLKRHFRNPRNPRKTRKTRNPRKTRMKKMRGGVGEEDRQTLLELFNDPANNDETVANNGVIDNRRYVDYLIENYPDMMVEIVQHSLNPPPNNRFFTERETVQQFMEPLMRQNMSNDITDYTDKANNSLNSSNGLFDGIGDNDNSFNNSNSFNNDNSFNNSNLNNDDLNMSNISAITDREDGHDNDDNDEEPYNGGSRYKKTKTKKTKTKKTKTKKTKKI